MVWHFWLPYIGQAILYSSPLAGSTNLHNSIQLTTYLLPAQPLHIRPEDGNCNVCRNSGQSSTFYAVHPQRQSCTLHAMLGQWLSSKKRNYKSDQLFYSDVKVQVHNLLCSQNIMKAIKLNGIVLGAERQGEGNGENNARTRMHTKFCLGNLRHLSVHKILRNEMLNKWVFIQLRPSTSGRILQAYKVMNFQTA